MGSEKPSCRCGLDFRAVAIRDHVRKLKFFSTLVICDKLESKKIVRGKTLNTRDIAKLTGIWERVR